MLRYNIFAKKTVTVLLFCLITTFIFVGGCAAKKVHAMPFYNLNPKDITLRAQFYTTYEKSSEERKSNILLAAKSIDNYLIDVGGEFSFNRVVGARTEKRGYKTAKIIVDGEFVDGVGGGVCQVSSTLYNAALLAGLSVTEYHPHSLPVSYVSPSFDAMVNSGSADLRFVNNTLNPVYIKTNADGKTLSIQIYGEPLTVKYVRESVITGEVPCPEDEILYDDNLEYPDLYEGEKTILKYGKAGYKSEGYLVTMQGDRVLSRKKIRSDKYNSTRSVVLYGRAVKEEILPPEIDFPQQSLDLLDLLKLLFL